MNNKTLFLNQVGLTNEWHLATTPLEAATTELEWAMFRWCETFERYQLEVLSRLNQSSLSTHETRILHVIRLQDRPKSTSMIASLLNRDDIQNVQYSLRKLIAQKLIKKVKDVGKGYNLAVTEKGRRLTDDLAAFRRRSYIEQLGAVEDGEAKLQAAAKMVSLVTGMCNEAGLTFEPSTPEDEVLAH